MEPDEDSMSEFEVRLELMTDVSYLRFHTFRNII